MQLISKPDLEPSRSRTSAAAPSRDIVHGVTFFRGTAFPAARIASFLCSGLETAPQRGAALVFASAAHSAAIRAALQEQAVDVDAELRARRLAFADAESIALALEHGDVQQVFCNEVESTVNEALRAHGRVNVYGEIVDLLVLAGRHEHAMHLERLWHELLQRGAAQLLCGYNFQGFGSARLTTTFQRICGAHSFVEPIEDGSRSRLRPPASARAQSYDGRTFAELDQALAALDTESRAKDEFLAVLGHELRNPLAPILTAVQVMGRRSPQLFTEERGMIERQVRHMVRLVEDLLDVSRIARGKVSLQCAAIEIERVIGDAITTVAPLIEERSHRLRTRAERGLFVLGDTQRLTQVLVNLLSNAAKYTPDGGEIEIDARRRDGHVEVSVRDSGAGIAPELLPQLFELFFQAPRDGDSGRGGGLGLGLSIAHSLVQLHGGTLRAESAGLGQGACFTLQLPATDEPDHDTLAGPGALPRTRRRHEPSVTGLHVLVVDDNEDAALILSRVLTGVGHKVRVAYCAEGALQACDRQIFDLALLDIGLPDLDGCALAACLRERFSERAPTMIATTAYGRDSDRRRSADSGFAAHLVKPIDLDDLLATVDALFRTSRRS